MRYLGSKTATAQSLYAIVSDLVPAGSFCDPFGGVGVVGATFKRHGYVVFACDVLRNAYNFQVARIERDRTPSFRRVRQRLKLSSVSDVVRQLNDARQYSGWFEREYAINRMFFTRVNARRIAGCRRLIYRWDRDGLLTPSEKSVF